MAGLRTWLETLPGRYGDRPEFSSRKGAPTEPVLASSRCSLADAGKLKSSDRTNRTGAREAGRARAVRPRPNLLPVVEAKALCVVLGSRGKQVVRYGSKNSVKPYALYAFAGPRTTRPRDPSSGGVWVVGRFGG